MAKGKWKWEEPTSWDYSKPEEIDMTGGHWQAVSDMRIPKPSINDNNINKPDKSARPSYDILKTKIIMAHELKDNPESYRNVAKTIVDAYNKAHTIKVFGEEEEEEEDNE